MIIREVRGYSPKIEEGAWIAENAAIIGDVHIGKNASVWYNCTLRGDVMPIRIGDETNVQDGTVIHGTFGKFGVTIAERVTIGHQVTLHGCRVAKACLIGMGSILMDNVEVGEFSIVGAGSLLAENKKYPPRSLILGRPAVVIRELTETELKFLSQSADNYLHYKTWFDK